MLGNRKLNLVGESGGQEVFAMEGSILFLASWLFLLCGYHKMSSSSYSAFFYTLVSCLPKAPGINGAIPPQNLQIYEPSSISLLSEVTYPSNRAQTYQKLLLNDKSKSTARPQFLAISFLCCTHRTLLSLSPTYGVFSPCLKAF